MAQIGYGVPTKGTLKEALEAIPEDFRAYFRTGFAQLAKRDPKVWADIARISRSSSARPSHLEWEPLGGWRQLDLPAEVVVASHRWG